jgi:hypothetical protein
MWPCSAIWQPSEWPSRIVISIASRFGTGSVPGCARQTGHVREFSGREVLELAAAEHLRPRLQVDVDLEADDRLPLHASLGGT